MLLLLIQEIIERIAIVINPTEKVFEGDEE
jgi:hypothetical protein